MATLKYALSRRWLHWSIVVLMVAAYLLIEFRVVFDRGTAPRAAMVQGYFWVGIAILALMLPRLLLAIRKPAPPVSPPLPRWQAVPAKAAHVLLYAMLIVQPLLGIATAWADGKPILVPFTSIALPALLATDKELADQLEDIHKLVANGFYFVVGLHVLAALYHHFGRRDDTLRRMI